MIDDQQTSSYVLCIDDGGYPESLEARKVYEVLPDDRAAANEYIRVIDETGEDYLYPRSISFPSSCRRKLQESCPGKRQLAVCKPADILKRNEQSH